MCQIEKQFFAFQSFIFFFYFLNGNSINLESLDLQNAQLSFACLETGSEAVATQNLRCLCVRQSTKITTHQTHQGHHHLYSWTVLVFFSICALLRAVSEEAAWYELARRAEFRLEIGNHSVLLKFCVFLFFSI